MLTSALINAADRLIATLMTLLRAVAPNATIPAFPNNAAQNLFFRLTDIVTTLIRVSAFGIRAPAKRAVTQSPQSSPTDPAPPRPPRDPAQCLPRRPGWLLAALPDIAHAVAVELATLLADPALAALLAAAPTLHRSLRPLLRSLGLTEAPPAPHASPPHAASAPITPIPLDPPRSSPTQPRPALRTAASNRPNETAAFPRPYRFDIATITSRKDSPIRPYSAATASTISTAAPKSTESSRDTPRSCIVTPYSRSIRAIVR